MDEDNKPHIIKDAKPLYISLDKERGPGRGYIVSVGPVRDKRWENVSGFVGPYIDEASLVVRPDIIHFHLELDYDGMHYWADQLMFREDLNDAVFLYGWLLNKMIWSIEKQIDEGETNG